MALVLILRPSGTHRRTRGRAAVARRRAVRVCIVGCGAVGLAVRGEPRAARRRRGLGLRPRCEEHVDAINADGLRLSGAGEVVRARSRARPRTRPSCPPVRLRDRRDEGDAHRGGDRARRAHAFADGAVCSVQNGARQRGGARRHVARVIRGHDLPGRPASSSRATCSGTSRATRRSARSSRARRRRRGGRAARRERARGPGMPTGRGRRRARRRSGGR